MCRREDAQKLLITARILLHAKNNDQKNIISLTSLSRKIICHILTFIPKKGLLSEKQKNNVIQFANNKETLNKSHDFLSFLKATNCLFKSPSSCIPTSSPQHKK